MTTITNNICKLFNDLTEYSYLSIPFFLYIIDKLYEIVNNQSKVLNQTIIDKIFQLLKSSKFIKNTKDVTKYFTTKIEGTSFLIELEDIKITFFLEHNILNSGSKNYIEFELSFIIDSKDIITNFDQLVPNLMPDFNNKNKYFFPSNYIYSVNSIEEYNNNTNKNSDNVIINIVSNITEIIQVLSKNYLE